MYSEPEKQQALAHNDFLHNYSRLLIQAWRDKGFVEKLTANPTKVLKEFDIIVPANTRIEIIREIADPNTADITTQVKAWEEASNTGLLTLYLPKLPQLFTVKDPSGDGNEKPSD